MHGLPNFESIGRTYHAALRDFSPNRDCGHRQTPRIWKLETSIHLLTRSVQASGPTRPLIVDREHANTTPSPVRKQRSGRPRYPTGVPTDWKAATNQEDRENDNQRRIAA